MVSKDKKDNGVFQKKKDKKDNGKGYCIVNSVLGLLIKPNVYKTTNTVVIRGNIAHTCISLVY